MKVVSIYILAIFTFCVICGTLAVAIFCHIGALSPSRFYADGQCAASDQPADVFSTFVLFSACLGMIGIVVVVVVMQLLKRMST